jgi:inner membrane protein
VDNVTHTLTGLMMARCGLDRTTPRGGALMLMLAANAPDIDVVTGFPGSLNYMLYHRGYTHSLAMAPVMAVLPLLLARWIGRAEISWRSYLACLAGVLSHLLMDWTNVYGIRLLLPFSSRWLHLDMTGIVDPWILAILFLALGAPALAGLVSSEIAGRKRAAPVAAWAWLALVGVTGYEGFRFVAHQRAVAVMSSYLYGGETAPVVAAIPNTLDPLRWRGVVEGDGFVLDIDYLLTEDYNPALGEVDYPTLKSAAIDAAKTTRPFQVFEQFNQLPFWKVQPAQSGKAVQVELIDLRFGTPRDPGFAVATALVGPGGKVREARFGFPFVR